MRYKKSGFSLLELLIILGVTASLLGIAGLNFAKQRQKGDLNQITQELGQNIRLARAQALAQGHRVRIKIGDRKRYFIADFNPTTNSWERRKRVMLNGKGIFTEDSRQRIIKFDTRGFADITSPNIPFTITNGDDTKEILISMTGNIIIRDVAHDAGDN